RRRRSRDSLMSLLSNLTITSPGISPAGLAGPLSSTPAMSAPRAGWMRTPSQAAGGKSAGAALGKNALYLLHNGVGKRLAHHFDRLDSLLLENDGKPARELGHDVSWTKA